MEQLDYLLKSDTVELLNTLPKYQENLISQLLESSNNDFLKAADLWLNSTPSNTYGFGGEPKKQVFYRDMLLEEIEKFLCGDEIYDDDRKKITESSDKTKQYAIGVLSTAIGAKIGVAGAFIAPIIVLLLLSIGKMAINAWCEMRIKNKGKEL
jgi:hypothetical protein